MYHLLEKWGQRYGKDDIDILFVDENGTHVWYKYIVDDEDEGQYYIHRDNDLPAIITRNAQIWVNRNIISREGSKPSIQLIKIE